jgi:Ras-related protein Rab-1A
MSRKSLQFIILGDAAVGKTSIINQYTGKGFDDEHIATLGIDFGQKKHTMKADGSEVGVKIWDTAGQERFRTLTTNFYRKADGIIVSFDVTDRKTFDGVATWMKAIKEHADAQADLVLCGNKIDLANDRQVSQAEG